MQYICRPGPFMQVIYILCNNLNVEIFFCLSNGLLCFVRLRYLSTSCSYLVVFTMPLTVCIPFIRGSNLFNSPIFPKPAAVPECAQAAFFADPCACQPHNIFQHTPSRR